MTTTLRMLTAALLLGATAFGQSYTVNQASTAPTIDGVISPGEWDGAADTALLTTDADGNSGFKLMWDSEALYGLVTTDYTNFLDPFGSVEYGWDAELNWNFYIDPDRDGEGIPADAGKPDGYQIAVHTYKGEFECQPCSDPDKSDAIVATGEGGSIGGGNPGTDIGTFAEGHIDANWGNQGNWAGMRDTKIAMVNGDAGGVSEIRIPWTDIDAPGNGTDTGLDLNDTAPIDGERWFFNLAYVYPNEGDWAGCANGNCPIWVGGTPFAKGPHGEITFAAGAGTGGPPCDLDADGDCDQDDINMVYDADGNVDDWLAQASAEAGDKTFVIGDVNLDGAVDSGDLGLLLNNFGSDTVGVWGGGDLDNSGDVDSGDLGLLLNNFGSASASTSAVPEPNAIVLLALGMLGLLRRRR